MFEDTFLSYANARTVLLGTALLGAASGAVGVFMMLRKRSLLGDAVAHAALPGVCFSYLVIGEKNFSFFLIGALLFGGIAAWFISFVRNSVRVKEDAVTAIVIGGFFGIGIALSRLIQSLPGGNKAGLDTFLFGKAASMISGDLNLIAVVAAGAIFIILLLLKELSVATFDREFAAVEGFPVKAIDLVLAALVCSVSVVGLPAVGVVLVVALFVIPAAAARFWSESLWTMLIIAGLFGLLSGTIGTALSATLPSPASTLSRGWPTGPVVTLVAFSIFLVSLLFAPKRGILSRYLTDRRFKRSIKEQRS